MRKLWDLLPGNVLAHVHLLMYQMWASDLPLLSSWLIQCWIYSFLAKVNYTLRQWVKINLLTHQLLPCRCLVRIIRKFIKPLYLWTSFHKLVGKRTQPKFEEKRIFNIFCQLFLEIMCFSFDSILLFHKSFFTCISILWLQSTNHIWYIRCIYKQDMISTFSSIRYF